MNAPRQLPAVADAPRPVATVRTGFDTVRTGFDTLEGFELMQRVAKMFSSSDLVPQQYRGNAAN